MAAFISRSSKENEAEGLSEYDPLAEELSRREKSESESMLLNEVVDD